MGGPYGKSLKDGGKIPIQVATDQADIDEAGKTWLQPQRIKAVFPPRG